MAFSAATTSSDIPTASPLRNSKLSSLRLNVKQSNQLFGTTPRRRRVSSLKVTRAVLDKRKPGVSDNGASEPTRILLERLFAQTQKLEEHMNRESYLSQDSQLGLNLETLEADLVAALAALKKKEEELQDAERTVFLENGELSRAQKELELRKREIVDAHFRYEKIEEELKSANSNLASQAQQIEDLKLRLKEMDEDVGAARTALALKEEEIERVTGALTRKSEEAARIDLKLRSKAQLLSQADEVVKGQETELVSLRRAIREKEEELEASLAQRKVEEGKLRAAESKLEKQAVDWSQAQEELKKLAKEAAKHEREANAAAEDFGRVEKLLAEARTELVSSRKSLALTREKMEEQEMLQGKRSAELEEQKRSVASYTLSLENAQIEIENERDRLGVAEARNKELEGDLSAERELVNELRERLKKEGSSLSRAVGELSAFQRELGLKSAEFEKTRNLLREKESELAEAKLEIQRLKSVQASLESLLGIKDAEIADAKKNLEVVSKEIADLKLLLNGKEAQLIQATTLLKEKDDLLDAVQTELDDTKQKASEAENVVGRIVELTNKLVVSIKEEDYGTFDKPGHGLFQQPWGEPVEDFILQKKQLEAELEVTKESLRMREMDVVIAQRSLQVKDEELKVLLQRSDEKERELKKMKYELEQDANDLKRLYTLAQERMGEKTAGDMAIEKLRIDSARLEVEAAASALHKLSEMSREFLNDDIDSDFSIFPGESSEFWKSLEENNESFDLVRTEVVRLSTLTEGILKDAGIAVVGGNCEAVRV